MAEFTLAISRWVRLLTFSKWNFVVLDLGANKRMLEGGVLMVHRNSQLVGKVRINEVLPDRSIASAIPGWNLGEIEEGDQVIYKE